MRRIFIIIIIFTSLLCFINISVWAKTIIGQVIKVSDGDDSDSDKTI